MDRPEPMSQAVTFLHRVGRGITTLVINDKEMTEPESPFLGEPQRANASLLPRSPPAL